MTRERILIVEDEKDISRIIQYHLRREGFETVSAFSGGAALDIIDSTELPSLILLDIMLPGIDGLEICRKVRENKRTRSIPVIMLTVKSDESDIIRGLKAGADDYITKPFSPRILVERIKTALRRKKTDIKMALPDKIKLLDIEMDVLKYQVKIKGKEILFSVLEFHILKLFMKNPGRVFSRQEIIDSSWGNQTPAPATDKTVDVHIAWLRQKLGASGVLIETVRGAGYRFKDVK